MCSVSSSGVRECGSVSEVITYHECHFVVQASEQFSFYSFNTAIQSFEIFLIYISNCSSSWSFSVCHSQTLEEVRTTEASAPHIILYTTIAPLRVSQIDLIVSELNEM